MPLERVSKSFKDLSLTFKSNPVNRDLLVLNNAAAIARSIRNLVSTYPGERFFNPRLGSDIKRVTFEQFDELIPLEIKSQIESTLELYEPRIKVDSVNVENNFDDMELNVTIKYDIIGIESPPQEISFALQPSR
jgi:phage baseplate assembly protein W